MLNEVSQEATECEHWCPVGSLSKGVREIARGIGSWLEADPRTVVAGAGHSGGGCGAGTSDVGNLTINSIVNPGA